MIFLVRYVMYKYPQKGFCSADQIKEGASIISVMGDMECPIASSIIVLVRICLQSGFEVRCEKRLEGLSWDSRRPSTRLERLFIFSRESEVESRSDNILALISPESGFSLCA